MARVAHLCTALIFGSALFGMRAHAASFAGARANGAPVRGEFTVLDAALRKAQTSLSIGGQEIPRVRPYCFEGFGGYRCPHRLQGLSAEVYPRLDADGEFRLHVILTDARGAESVTLNPEPTAP